jgi:hypothetical protein
MAEIDLKSLHGLSETLKRLIKAHDEGDVETQRSILTEFAKHEQATYQRKLRLLAELKTLKQEVRAARTPEDKISRLVTLYKFAADVRGIGKDRLDDQETYLTANSVVREVSAQFRALGTHGMATFESLLDDPSPNVRACAGFSLVAALPEKTIPILEAIEQSPGLSCASFTAHFALAKYRSEIGKSSTS